MPIQNNIVKHRPFCYTINSYQRGELLDKDSKMGDINDKMMESFERGNLNISNEVISTIANIAASEVAGLQL